MAGYLRKFIGKYTVLAQYDRSTNDWVRDEFHNLDESFDDYYIPLKNNIGNILACDDNFLIIELTNADTGLYRRLKTIQKNNPVKNMHDLDGNGEHLIHIKAKDLDKYLACITPMTTNKSRDPFDYRNLPNPYKIPAKDLKSYTEIASSIASEGNFKLDNLCRQFIKNNCNSDLVTFRKSGLTFINYIHQQKKWQEFLDFLQKKH